MLCYIFFVLVIGVPVITAEFVMGREHRSGILGAYRLASGSRRLDLAGYSGILAGIMILSFYSVVAGWTMEYTVESVTGRFNAVADSARHEAFGEFISGWRSVMWTVVFLLINGIVVIGGVKKGVERISNILMPTLFVIIIAFCIYSLTLPGASAGLDFLFRPDFSRLTPDVILSAMGQAFFSLSIGLGCMMTYASYFQNKTPLVKSALSIGALDTLVAILAGVIIFPAVFTFGVSPAEGPTLVFEVLPSIFVHLPAGRVWSALFFFLLFVGSLTSTISMSEIFIAFLCDEFKMGRKPATVLTTSIALVLGTLCALSFGPLSGLNLFNLFDFTTSNILLPLGGMIVSLFVGWRLDPEVLRRQLRGHGTIKPWVVKWILVCLRFIAPAGIAAVFVAGLL